MSRLIHLEDTNYGFYLLGSQLCVISLYFSAINKNFLHPSSSYNVGFYYAQPGPDSIGIIAISHGCTGVAARACGLVGLEPTRVSPCPLLPLVNGEFHLSEFVMI